MHHANPSTLYQPRDMQPQTKAQKRALLFFVMHYLSLKNKEKQEASENMQNESTLTTNWLQVKQNLALFIETAWKEKQKTE